MRVSCIQKRLSTFDMYSRCVILSLRLGRSREISIPSITFVVLKSCISNRLLNSCFSVAIASEHLPTIRRSSTYKPMIRIFNSVLRKYRQGSCQLPANFRPSTRSLCIFAYHWRGACFSPYRDFGVYIPCLHFQLCEDLQGFACRYLRPVRH